MTQIHTATKTSSNSILRRATWWHVLGVGILATTVLNLVIFGIGTAAGASFAMVDGPGVHQVSGVDVLLASVVPLAVGAGLATLLALWRLWMLRVAQIVGVAAALLTSPVFEDTDGTTIASLTAMHVIAALAVVFTLEGVRRTLVRPGRS